MTETLKIQTCAAQCYVSKWNTVISNHKCPVTIECVRWKGTTSAMLLCDVHGVIDLIYDAVLPLQGNLPRAQGIIDLP